MNKSESYYLTSLNEHKKSKETKPRGFFLSRKVNKLTKKNNEEEKERARLNALLLASKIHQANHYNNKHYKKNKKSKKKKRISCNASCELEFGQNEPNLSSYIVDCENC